MANLASRIDLKNYALRKLGHPVIQVNLDPQQMEDRMDEAFQYFQDYHADAINRYYFKYLLQQVDIDNAYITINDPLIIGVNRILPLQTETMNMFDVRYQIRLNDFYNFNNISMVHYDLAMQHLALLDWFFGSNYAQFRFNRYENKIYLDFDLEMDVVPNQYIILECTRCIDPTQVTAIYNDRFLKQYTTLLFKEQWGQNLKKFGNIQLPGGVILNGQQIYDEAVREKEEEEGRLRNEYQSPVPFLMG